MMAQGVGSRLNIKPLTPPWPINMMHLFFSNVNGFNDILTKLSEIRRSAVADFGARQ